MTDAERHRRARERFDRACDLPAGQRTRFVEETCGDDPALGDEVLALLKHDASEASLGSPVVALAHGILVRETGGQHNPVDGYPEQIGNYRIVRRVGEGGMGTLQALHADPATSDSYSIVEAYIELYEAWQRPDDAARWRAQLPE